jgi:hypothetical protein
MAACFNLKAQANITTLLQKRKQAAIRKSFRSNMLAESIRFTKVVFKVLVIKIICQLLER